MSFNLRHLADPTHSSLTATTLAYCLENPLIMACLLSTAIISSPSFSQTFTTSSWCHSVAKTATKVLPSAYSPTFSSILQKARFKKSWFRLYSLFPFRSSFNFPNVRRESWEHTQQRLHDSNPSEESNTRLASAPSRPQTSRLQVLSSVKLVMEEIFGHNRLRS